VDIRNRAQFDREAAPSRASLLRRLSALLFVSCELLACGCDGIQASYCCCQLLLRSPMAPGPY